MFLYVPILFLPLFSLNDSQFIAFPLKGFTLRWYEDLLDNVALHKALWNSIKVGAFTALVATIFGLFGAKAITRYQLPGQKPLVAIIMLPLVVPGVILGTSLLILVSRLGLGLTLYNYYRTHTDCSAILGRDPDLPLRRIQQRDGRSLRRLR